MALKLKPLDQQVIVITGATSGIGLATAQAAAKAGAKLILAARSETDLRRVAADLGSQVEVVAADVAKPDDVQRIAHAAKSRFGGFDTWVNNAGVGIFGRIEDGNLKDYRRLFDTNYWGVVNGSLEAIKQLKHHGGALINVGSVVSDVAVALQGVYSSSKHAVKGFTDALRMELESEDAPVSVTLIKPSAIDTPFPQNARNYLPQEPKLPAPVYAPEEVAMAILHAATHPHRDIIVGGGGRAMSTMNRLAPGAMDWIGAHGLTKQQTRNEAPRNPQGGLHQPNVGGKARGDHPGHVMEKSIYTRAALYPKLTMLAVAGAAAAVFWLNGRNERSGVTAESLGASPEDAKDWMGEE